MESVMDMARVAFGGETLARISAWLNESPASTRAAVQDALPVSLLGVASQATSEEGSRELLGRIQRGDYPHLEPEDLGRALADPTRTDQVAESSQGFMDSMFGNKLGPVVAGVSRHTGVSQSAASKLLGLAAPLIAGMIGRRALTEKLDAGGLRRFLGEQRRVAAGMLPGSLSGLLGSGATPALVEQSQPETFHVEEPRRGVAWWMIIVLAVAGVVAFWLMRAHRRPPPQRAIDTSYLGVPAAPLVNANVAALAYFLESQESTPKRFVLDGLKFVDATAQLDPASVGVLNRVSEVLLDHPTAQFRLDGHTDAGGSPKADRQLSLARAEATRRYLVGRGVEPGRLATAGLGTDRPVAGDDTPAGQAENRRIELVVIAR